MKGTKEQPRTIVTKYGGKCIVCTGSIRAGESCRWYPKRGIAHKEGNEECRKLVDFGNRTAGGIFANACSEYYVDEFMEDYQNAHVPNF